MQSYSKKLNHGNETDFRALKSSGFNIEDTHLTDWERIEKLFSTVMVAFAWAYAVGVYINDRIRLITIKTHGRRAKSFLIWIGLYH